jgi:hypothetical protein
VARGQEALVGLLKRLNPESGTPWSEVGRRRLRLRRPRPASPGPRALPGARRARRAWAPEDRSSVGPESPRP